FGEVARGPVPIFEEVELDRLNDGAFDFNVCVAPWSEFRMAAQVFVADVEAAHIRHAAVDNHALEMVAKVDLKPIAQTARSAKRQRNCTDFGQLAAIRAR